jgi:hypothetical protein
MHIDVGKTGHWWRVTGHSAAVLLRVKGFEA